MGFVPPKEKRKAILLASSEEITSLQKQLNAILTAENKKSITTSGIFTPETKNALDGVQSLLKVHVDGIYGNQTKAAIEKYLNEYLPAKREAERAYDFITKEGIPKKQVLQYAEKYPFLKPAARKYLKELLSAENLASVPVKTKVPDAKNKSAVTIATSAHPDTVRVQTAEADSSYVAVKKKTLPPTDKNLKPADLFPDETLSQSQLLEKKLAQEIGKEKAQKFLSSLNAYCDANGIGGAAAYLNLNDAFESIKETTQNLWELRELEEKKDEWVRGRYSPKGKKEVLFEIVASAYFIQQFFGISASFMISLAGRETQFRDISGANGRGPWQLTSLSSISELKKNYWLEKVQTLLPFGLESPITSLRQANSSILNNAISAAETVLLKIAILNEEQWSGNGNWTTSDLKTDEAFRKKVLERYNAHEEYMSEYSKGANRFYLFLASKYSVASV